MKKIITGMTIKIFLLISSLIGLFLLYILFADSTTKLASYFINFASHHYFYVCFILVFIILLAVRYHLLKQEKKMISKNYENQFLTLKSKNMSNKEIKEFSFTEEDVLLENEEIDKRKKEITLALKLGVLLRKKVCVYFQDTQSYFKIEDLVISKKNDRIMLFGGGSIPIVNILKIEIIRR